MRRYTITLGASTTAGGKVTSASSNGSINGVKIALEGDSITCPACKAQGKILCVGPRIPEMWNGKQVALEWDLCSCGCFPSPKLIANQSLRCQSMESESASGNGGESGRESVSTGSGDPVNSYDLDFLILDLATGMPRSDWPYSIELTNGNHLHGRTDASGKTAKITAECAEHAVLHVYAPEVTPIIPYWDR